MGKTLPRDVDLPEWLDGTRHHAPSTERTVNGHEIARALIGEVGQMLHELLPPGRDKSLVFTHLEEALMRANRAIALNDGPQEGLSDAFLAKEADRSEMGKHVAKSPDGDSLFIDVSDATVTLAHTMDDRTLSIAVNGEVRVGVEPRERQQFTLPPSARTSSAEQVDWLPGFQYAMPGTDENGTPPAYTYESTVASGVDREITVDIHARPGYVELGTVSTPERIRLCLDAAQSGEETFLGLFAGYDGIEGLNGLLRELAGAGEAAFGSTSINESNLPA